MLRRSLITLAVIAAFPQASSSQSQRLKDDDVKKLMEEAKKDVERFEDKILSQYRKATIRTEASEVSLDGYLKDLKKSAETARDRFKEDYAAGREALSLLRLAHALESRAASGGGLFGAEKEWPRLRGTLARLAKAYGVDWSTSPENWTARRMNDRELREAIEKLSSGVESFKKSLESALEHVTGIASADRKAVLTAIDRLKSSANDLKDAVGDGKDGSKALERMNASMKEIQSFLDARGLTSAAGSTFRMLQGDLSTISGALH
jgi:hypothetical protein